MEIRRGSGSRSKSRSSRRPTSAMAARGRLGRLERWSSRSRRHHQTLEEIKKTWTRGRLASARLSRPIDRVIHGTQWAGCHSVHAHEQDGMGLPFVNWAPITPAGRGFLLLLSPKPRRRRHFQAAAMVGGGKPLGDSVFGGHAAAGAAAISASTVSVHPLDTVKTLLQASAPTRLSSVCCCTGASFSRSDFASARCLLASAAGRRGAEAEDGAPAGGGPAHGCLRPCRFGWLLNC